MLKAIAPPAVALVLCAAAAPAAWKLSPDGYGPLRIGMTEAQAAQALGVNVSAPHKPDPGADVQAMADYEACHDAVPEGLEGLYFLVEGGRIASIGVGAPSRIRTANGVGIGDSETRVRRAYGAALKVEPHEYVEAPAHYLTFQRRGGNGIRFSTDQKGVVTDIAAGGAAITYTEGCS